MYLFNPLYYLCTLKLYLILKFRALCTEDKVAESEAVLDPSGNFLLKWRVDYSVKNIRFTVEIAKEAPLFRWFSLGFSDRGSLNNSDVCIVWLDYQGVQRITVSTD